MSLRRLPRLLRGICVSALMVIAFILASQAIASNIWAVGNIVGLCKGTHIYIGPGLAFHTIVPENDWKVMVIGGPRFQFGEAWWDTSRRAAGDPSGGTGWVKQSEADSCFGGGGGGGGGGFTDVTVCTDDSGQTGCLSFGVSIQRDLSEFGLNDNIKSAIVPSGKSVFLFRDIGMRGGGNCIVSTQTPLKDNSGALDLYEDVSSFEVFDNGECSNVQSVLLYDSPDYGGYSWGVGFEEGLYNLTDSRIISNSQYYENTAESVKFLKFGQSFSMSIQMGQAFLVDA